MVGCLHALERQLRAVLAASGELTIATTEAQAALTLSPTAGHQILAGISAAQVSASDALSRVAQAHRLMEVLGTQIGIDVSAFGETKPPATQRFLTGAIERQPAIVD